MILYQDLSIKRASTGSELPAGSAPRMSSLFGQLSSQAPSSGSAFPPTSSLFGQSASQAPSSGSAFPPTSSLFGDLATSKPENKTFSGSTLLSGTGGQTDSGGTSNFFGGLGQQQTKSSIRGGGLFGASEPATTQSHGTSQFSNDKTASAPSMFGNTATTSGPSLFGNTATSAAPSIFGSTATTSQPQQQQQSNGSTSDNPLRSTGPAYFNSLLEKGKKRTRKTDAGSGLGDLPSLQLGLGDLARRARELGGTEQEAQRGGATDSRAHYLLAGSGVNSGATRRNIDSLSGQTVASRPVPKVAEWDPDTHKYINQMQQQSTMKMINEGIQRAHKQFDLYLEENVDINWDLQRKRIYEHFGLVKASASLDESKRGSSPAVTGSFGRSTRKGRGGNSERPGQGSLNRSIFGNSGLQKSVIGSPSTGNSTAPLFADVAEKNSTSPAAPIDRFTREKEGKFAEKVQRLNQARLREAPSPVLHEFSEIESQQLGESPSQLLDAYKALIEIVNEPTAQSISKDTRAPKERQFSTEYLDETPNSAKSISIRKRIIDGSRRCLEKAFYEQLESLVARNPKEANIGGVPTTVNKVRAYIRILAARKELSPDGTELQALDGDYCWAFVFFLLRSGLVKEAADYVTSNAAAFRALDRNFVTYITNYASSPDRRLSRPIQDRINAEYQQRTRIAPENSLDPYRMACYKVIGRCELARMKLESVGQGIEDWIWLQFALAREVNRVEESAGEVHGLEEVRETIREIGARYFSKGSEGMGSYGTYFFLQILGGMFEQAVSFLYSYSVVAAVHFAIALDYYGLLRVSDFSISETELLTHNTKELPQISFGRMLGYYTRDFRASNAEFAVDYLTLICLNADLPGAMGKSQTSLCHEALRELVLETREFAQLLGDIQGDGTRLKGAIEQRLKLIGLADQEDFLKTVTIQAASVADDNGRTTDAVLLYHLAEDYDNVIQIINRALSEAIAVEIGEGELRLQPLKPRLDTQNQQQPAPGSSLSLTSVDDPALLARNMITLYNSNALYYQKIRATNREACGILLRMSEVKAKVAADQWAEALDIISSLSLLPLNASGSIPTIRAAATAFNSLPPPVSRNIGPLLLWTITCIGQQREVLRTGGQYENETRRQMGEELLRAAKDLMVFAGLVKYRLGERVWAAVTGAGGEVGVY